MQVAIYARVSRDTSDNTNQLLLLREYCQKMGYQVYREYMDVVSGAKEKRPQFDEMMKDASKRKFDLLLFFALDRLSRQGALKTLNYLQLLESYNVSYKSYSEQYLDSSGVFKDALVAILSTLAKQERLRISERVHAGLAKARQQGRIGGRPTLEAAKIEKIREMKSAGLSIVTISQKLNISRGSVYQYL
jgi:DNA invertase Pin-like site-specific DNA recombinase